MMRSLLPQSLRDHFEFAEAFDQFGCALFPEQWTGSEVSPPRWDSALPPEEAAMQDEDARLRSILKGRGYRYDDDYIRQIFEMDEHCDVWRDAWLTRDQNDPSNWAVVVARLSRLIEALSESPATKTQAFLELTAVHARRQEALIAMLALLADGKLGAFCEDGHVRTRIKSELWADKTLDIDIANNTANRFSPAIVVFRRNDFGTLIREISSSEGERTKLGAANAAEAELIQLMSDPDQPRLLRDSVFKDFKKWWPNLSERDFKLCWKIACGKTKSGWDKPGRVSSSA